MSSFRSLSRKQIENLIKTSPYAMIPLNFPFTQRCNRLMSPQPNLMFSRIAFSCGCFEFIAAFGTFYAYFAFALWNPAPLTAMRTFFNRIVQSRLYPPSIKTLNYFIPDNESRHSAYVHVPQFLLRLNILLNIFFYVFVTFFSKKLLGCAAMGSHVACIHGNCLHHNPFPAMPSIIQ